MKKDFAYKCLVNNKETIQKVLIYRLSIVIIAISHLSQTDSDTFRVE